MKGTDWARSWGASVQRAGRVPGETGGESVGGRMGPERGRGRRLLKEESETLN